jgi:hypothetical protein
MATAYVTIGPVVARNVFEGKLSRSETVTTSGVAANGAIVAAAGEVAQVFCATAVYARSGNSASTTNGVFCPGGVPNCIAMTEGDVISLIDA